LIRLHVVAEGQTEEAFVNQVLKKHLSRFRVYVDVRCVETSRKRGRVFRGGVLNYDQVKRDVSLWISEDRKRDARFTTMLDLYALPESFPGFEAARNLVNPMDRVQQLETAFERDLNHPRFIPYLQLYEFEALLFSEPARAAVFFIGEDKAIKRLEAIASSFPSPEHIDDGFETAPSKRIARELPRYAFEKSAAGPIIAGEIGLAKIREKCAHFNAWLTRLEKLASSV